MAVTAMCAGKQTLIMLWVNILSYLKHDNLLTLWLELFNNQKKEF